MIIGKTRTNQPVEGEEELKIFENIVDKDGHKRFIEGDIDLATISGTTKTYGKWSLSGSHLLIVLAFDVENNITFGSTTLANVQLPAWLMNKIYPLYATNVITSQAFPIKADDYTGQEIGIVLVKGSESLGIYMSTTITTTKVRHGRIAFDLLIDNE